MQATAIYTFRILERLIILNNAAGMMQVERGSAGVFSK